eukprot:scaffold35347_cov52-Phaeocystis_antarctica.AAC.1
MGLALIAAAIAAACTDVCGGCTCGASNGGGRCSAVGQCCSEWGSCGFSPDHCNANQQAEYSHGGNCGVQAPSPSPPPLSPPMPCDNPEAVWACHMSCNRLFGSACVYPEDPDNAACTECKAACPT